MPKFSHKSYCYIIAFVCFFTRLVIIGSAVKNLPANQVWRGFHQEDSHLYRGLAQSFAQNGLLKDEPARPPQQRMRMPLYPLWFLLGDKMSSALGIDSSLLCVLGNIFLFWGACHLLFLMVSALTNPFTGLVSALLLALQPSVLPYSLILQPESLSLFFSMLCLYAALRGFREAKWTWLFLSGASSALAALSKPVYLYYEVVLLGGVLLWYLSRKRFPARMLFFQFGGFLLTLAPWFLRNWIVWHALVFCPQGGFGLYYFLKPAILIEAGLLAADDKNPAHSIIRRINDPELAGKTLPEQDAILSKWAMDDLRPYPLIYLRLWAKRTLEGVVGTGTRALAELMGIRVAAAPNELNGLAAMTSWLSHAGMWPYQIWAWGSNALLYLLCLVGIFEAYRRRNTIILTGSVLSLLYFWGVYGPILTTRYRFGMAPFFAVLAGLGFSYLLQLNALQLYRYKTAKSG